LFAGYARVTVQAKYAFLVLFECLANHGESVDLFLVLIGGNIAHLERCENTILSSNGIANRLARNGNGKETATSQERQVDRLERKGSGRVQLVPDAG